MKLLVVDKQNGGKADSLNVGLDAARFPYVLACDADTLIEPDALLRLARPFLHAARLGFTHPVEGHRLEFTSPLPADLQDVLDALRASAGGPEGPPC